jgi:hypothetical protein
VDPPGYDGPMNPACQAEPQVGMFNPIVEWTKVDWTVDPGATSVMMAPIVTSLNDDNNDGVIDETDQPDIVYVSYGGSQNSPGTLRAITGDGQTELLSVVGSGLCATSGLAAGDIDGDGVVELVGVTTSLAVIAFEHDGAVKWTSPALAGDMSFCHSTPAIADLDGDGAPEIIAGRAILDSAGAVVGKGQFGLGASQYASASFAVDITGDGAQEVVVGDAIYRKDGSAVWNIPEPDGYPGVADFDGDGSPEIVVSVSSAGALRLQDANGGVVWSVAIPGGGGGPPTIADYDGDGEPEIGVAGLTAYTVFDGDGTVLWQQPTQDVSSAVTGSSVYDFEGDGVADVVYADETTLWVYSGVDGTVKLAYTDHTNDTVIEYPIVVDVDDDGQVELLVVHNGAFQGITVLGDADASWRPGLRYWNQHAFSITNVNPDGTIPPMPTPNWTVYNNFRSGDISPPDGGAAPDLTVEASICQFECAEDMLELWVHLGNVGASPLTAGAEIQVYGVEGMTETLLATKAWVGELPPGKFADAEMFMLNATTYDTLVVRAVANEEECDLDNNEVSLHTPFCQIPK